VLEPLNTLAFAAALTRTVKIATGILVLPVRHPVVLAKEISTLCYLSDNRYVFGVGPGWYAREYEVTGSRIEEHGRRTDEIIEAVTLLLTRPNASYQGKYYQFDDVTIEPRPPKMPAIWVSGGSRAPDPTHHDVPVIARTVMDRIVKAGNWLSRCSGKQEWVKRDWLQLQQHAKDMGNNPRKLTFGHCNFIHLVDTASHDKAVAQSKAPFLRVMGTHRSYEHLQECYMVGASTASTSASTTCERRGSRTSCWDTSPTTQADRPHGQESISSSGGRITLQPWHATIPVWVGATWSPEPGGRSLEVTG
jgi:hypothetical protein